MTASSTLAQMIRWMLFTAMLAAGLLGVLALAGVPMPSADPLLIPGGRIYRFEAIASRWWDPLGVAILTGYFFLLRSQWKRFYGDASEECSIALYGFFLVAISCGPFFYGWTSTQESLAKMAYVPVVFLAFAAANGVVMGLLGITDLRSRTALIMAALAPLTFAMVAAVVGGIGEGFMHALVSAGSLGLIGSVLSTVLCLFAIAMLKKGFLASLGRWLADRRAKNELLATPAHASPPIVGTSPMAERERIAGALTALEDERAALLYRLAALDRNPDVTRS